ncbi:hypothetical protein, partial [Escherichia coli]|uniref:hypothetical protein n=2 Tax=Pseudomonadota TaxID=1224 RepID=UPI0019531290
SGRGLERPDPGLPEQHARRMIRCAGLAPALTAAMLPGAAPARQIAPRIGGCALDRLPFLLAGLLVRWAR